MINWHLGYSILVKTRQFAAQKLKLTICWTISDKPKPFWEDVQHVITIFVWIFVIWRVDQTKTSFWSQKLLLEITVKSVAIPMKVGCCFDNFNQTMHFTILSIFFFPDGQPVELVKSVTYYMNDDFKQKLWDSCKDVYSPSTSSPAVTLMCGEWGNLCTPERWFSFMGDVTVLAPFQINYEFSNLNTDDGMVPHKNHPIPCNRPAPVSNSFLIFRTSKVISRKKSYQVLNLKFGLETY